jgi:hypothetical protein
MIRFLADENFDNDVIRGVRRANPKADIVRVQDTHLFHADDPTILAWAADEGRILLTHDVKTMTKFAYERVAAGLPMPGIIEVNEDLPIGQTIEDLLIIIGSSEPEEWDGQVRYLPLR